VRRLALLLVVTLAFGLASCLTGDAPQLKPEDLVQAKDLPGTYTAIALPGNPGGQPPSVDARVEAAKDGSYFLTFIEADHVDTPTRLRLLPDQGDRYLCVFTEADSPDRAMYGRLEHEPAGGWAFHIFDIKPERRTEDLQPILQRHGVEKIVFEQLGSDPATTADHIQGALSAAQIRALFSDPDVLAALQTDAGFRLQPKAH